MPTTLRPGFTTDHAPRHTQEETIFAKPAGRWLALLSLVFSLLLLGYTINSNPEVELLVKTVLFTVPVTAYLLYRSFVRHQ